MADKLYATRDEVRAFDRHCIETLGIPGIVLMENAGRQIADVARAMLDRGEFRHCLILAGRGNNGGDAFVVARHLAIHGYMSEVILIGNRDDVKGDAATNMDIFQAMGGYVRGLDGATGEILRELAPTFCGADLIIDGLLGTGTQGEIREPYAGVITAVNATGRPVVAIDLPSGLDCDTGRPLGPTIRAAKTVTMAARKTGFQNPDSRQFTGEVILADIGAPYKPPRG
jgi:NAD(P)H-hydrate epimerase